MLMLIFSPQFLGVSLYFLLSLLWQLTSIGPLEGIYFLASTVFDFCSLSVLHVALAENGKFLLGARKSRHATFTEYIISLNADDMSKGSSAYIGKLKCVLRPYLFDFWMLIISDILIVLFPPCSFLAKDLTF